MSTVGKAEVSCRGGASPHGGRSFGKGSDKWCAVNLDFHRRNVLLHLDVVVLWCVPIDPSGDRGSRQIFVRRELGEEALVSGHACVLAGVRILRNRWAGVPVSFLRHDLVYVYHIAARGGKSVSHIGSPHDTDRSEGMKSKGYLLGCARHDSLQSFNLSLNLLRIFLSVHLLLAETAILHAIGIVEEISRLVVLRVTEYGQKLFKKLVPVPRGL